MKVQETNCIIACSLLLIFSHLSVFFLYLGVFEKCIWKK